MFTTRVDTIFGATSVQLAPEHPLVIELAANDAGLKKQVSDLLDEQRKAREAGNVGEIDKHGVPTGHFAINPYSGERVPIWVANYVLLEYGTGAIMSVPGPRRARLRIRHQVRDSRSSRDCSGGH